MNDLWISAKRVTTSTKVNMKIDQKCCDKHEGHNRLWPQWINSWIRTDKHNWFLKVKQDSPFSWTGSKVTLPELSESRWPWEESGLMIGTSPRRAAAREPNSCGAENRFRLLRNDLGSWALISERKHQRWTCSRSCGQNYFRWMILMLVIRVQRRVKNIWMFKKIVVRFTQ